MDGAVVVHAPHARVRLQIHVHDAFGVGDQPGAGDEHVRRPELALDLGRQSIHRFGIRDVAGIEARLPALGADRLGDRLPALAVHVQQGDCIAVAGQPVFVMARPDGRQVWVNFAFPDNGKVQVVDTETLAVAKTLEPGRAVLHLEFTPRGEAVWISARDDDRVVVYDTATLSPLTTLAAASPSGIFFTTRAARIGF